MAFRHLLLALACTAVLGACSTPAERATGIPMHTLALGMTKDGVVTRLGAPQRVMLADTYEGKPRQIWAYQQDKLVWLTGNSFLGGTTRNDQTTYLLAFLDDKLIAWKDAALIQETSADNVFEVRHR